MYDNSEKFKVLIELQDSVSTLERMSNFFKLIPETKTNFVYSIEKPKDLDDIAGVLGRVTNLGINIRTPNVIKFGASVPCIKCTFSSHQIQLII